MKRKIIPLVLLLGMLPSLSGCDILIAHDAGPATSLDEQPRLPATPAAESEPTAEEAVEVPQQEFEVTDIFQYQYAGERQKNNGALPWLYDFSVNKACGFGSDGSYRDAEMSYGLIGKVEGRKLYYSFYDHTDSGISVDNAIFISSSKSKEVKISSGKTFINTAKLANGLYFIRATFPGSQTATLAFYVNGNSTWLCSVSYDEDEINTFRERREKLYQLIDEYGINPLKSLSTEQLCYPCYPFDESFRCDTVRWMELADELTEPDWTPERKLFAMHEWMADNLAYDEYVANVIDSRRDDYFEDWSGTYSMYDTHAGVCWDYSNVLVTMCRAQEIPAISIESVDDSHMWIAVYINGIWTELDPTQDIHKYVIGEDVNDFTSYDGDRYYGYFSLLPNPLEAESISSINEYLYDADKASFGFYVKRPD